MNYGNYKSWDVQMLIDVLAQGEEQTKELETVLDVSPSLQQCNHLVHQIRTNLRNAITIVRAIEPNATVKPTSQTIKPRFEWTTSNSGGQQIGERSAGVLKNSGGRQLCGKRSKQPKWTTRIFATPGGEVESLEDGYNWRKYGQKYILGAMYPRAYYRCTYRKTIGCIATKQVQRTNENPSIFDVIYQGEHSCMKSSQRVTISHQLVSELQNDISRVCHESQVLQESIPHLHRDIDVEFDRSLSPISFSFPSTPVTKVISETSISNPGILSSPMNELDYIPVSLWNDTPYTPMKF